MSEAEKAASPKKNRAGRYVLIGVAVFFAAVLAAAVTMVCMIFTFPKPVPPVQLSGVDIYNQSRLANKILRQAKKSPDKLNTLRLKESEVNSLIRSAAYCQENFSDKGESFKLRDMDLVYKDGVFSGVIPCDTGMRFLNGGVIEISFSAKVSKVPGKIKIDVLSAKAGRVPLSLSFVNRRLQEDLASSRMKKTTALLDSMIVEMSTDPEGRLKLTYYPQQVMNAIFQR